MSYFVVAPDCSCPFISFQVVVFRYFFREFPLYGQKWCVHRNCFLCILRFTFSDYFVIRNVESQRALCQCRINVVLRDASGVLREY